MRPATLAVTAALVAASSPLAAAARAPTNGVDDPFEKFNRAGFAIEGVLDRLIIGPLAHLYHALTPGPIGAGLHNLVTNLTEPMATANGILQLRPKRAGASGARFLLNSTVGLAGLIDVAAKLKIHHRPNSFGDTLGRYGMGAGPYIFYPIGGPSSVRDSIGEIVDIVADPVHLLNYAYRTEVSVGVGIAKGLDQRIRTEADFRALLSDAADPYATLRSTYLQARRAEVSGEAEPAPDLPDLDQPTLVPAPGPSPSTAGAPELTTPKPTEGSTPGGQDKPASLERLPDQ